MSKKNVSRPTKIPQIHKDRDYDCVYVKRKKIMLGKSGTPEAEEAYRQIQIKILTDPTFSASKPQQITAETVGTTFGTGSRWSTASYGGRMHSKKRMENQNERMWCFLRSGILYRSSNLFGTTYRGKKTREQ